jgi:LPS-assembly lipoprotein
MILAAAAFGTALMLAGCGFRPLYGESQGGSAENLASIRVEPLPDRIGQQLYTLLLERLTPKGIPSHPEYTLDVRLNESRQDLAERRDSSATRSNLVIRASYTLATNDPRHPRQFSGQATSINSYDRVTSEFATLTAEEDARDRALRTLADEIRIRIAAALDNPQAFVAPPSTGRRQSPQERQREQNRQTPLGTFLPPRE